MIMVVVLFLCCNTLALIVNMIETFFSPDPLLLNLLSDASNFLVIFNSSVNCVIYMIFNKEYRETFLLHAGRLLDFLKLQCGCCLSPRRTPHNRSFREHRLHYKPISSPTTTSVETVPHKRPDSLMHDTNNSQKEYGSCQSPVWLPLTSSSGLNNASLSLGEFWSTPFCCDQLVAPNSAFTGPRPRDASPEFVLMDDDGVDSGCDESPSCSQYTKSPTRSRQVQKSWIAEVKIVESGDGRFDKRPHIVVKPISGFKPDGISITAL
uniref:G_PROTEIN_RECEP_F1_2 domain-containing protein n=1 Tax=Steinernema glaseri TaxID=37863 RepID=A0A1I7YV36_9BILA